MSFTAFPNAAAWRHQDARTGFEVVYFEPRGDGYRVDGYTSAVEDGHTWAVSYVIELDAGWATRTARISGRSASGSRQVLLEADGAGHWLIDGVATSSLDGCLDVDLEASALTNALPVRRMGLPVDGEAAAPAAYVRAIDLAVERLEQRYMRGTDADAGGTGRQRYHYTAPAFDFACELVYDASGLVLDYPGLAARAA